MRVEGLLAEPDNGLSDTVAYCAKDAWLTNDTVRNNFLFGIAYDLERFEAVSIHLCLRSRLTQTLAHGNVT